MNTSASSLVTALLALSAEPSESVHPTDPPVDGAFAALLGSLSPTTSDGPGSVEPEDPTADDRDVDLLRRLRDVQDARPDSILTAGEDVPVTLGWRPGARPATVETDESPQRDHARHDHDATDRKPQQLDTTRFGVPVSRPATARASETTPTVVTAVAPDRHEGSGGVDLRPSTPTTPGSSGATATSTMETSDPGVVRPATPTHGSLAIPVDLLGTDAAPDGPWDVERSTTPAGVRSGDVPPDIAPRTGVPASTTAVSEAARLASSREPSDSSEPLAETGRRTEARAETHTLPTERPRATERPAASTPVASAHRADATSGADQPAAPPPPTFDAQPDRTTRPGLSAAVERVLEAIADLEHAPPPRRLTLEIGESRVRVSIEDGQVRVTALTDDADTHDLLDAARDELADRGFDPGDDTRRHDDGRDEPTRDESSSSRPRRQADDGLRL